MSAVATYMLEGQELARHYLAMDLKDLYQQVANCFLYDHLNGGPVQAKAGLHVIEQFCTAKENRETWKTRYEAWRRSYDLIKNAGMIPKKLPESGAWVHFLRDSVSDDRWREMIEFCTSLAKAEMGKATIRAIGEDGYTTVVATGRGDRFVQHLCKSSIPVMQAIICKRLHDVAETHLNTMSVVLTEFWKKHVKELLDLADQSKFSEFAEDIRRINGFAKNDKFDAQIRTNIARPEDFTVDTDALRAGFADDASSSGYALKGFGRALERMRDIAKRGWNNDKIISAINAMIIEFSPIRRLIDDYGKARMKYRNEEILLYQLCEPVALQRGGRS